MCISLSRRVLQCLSQPGCYRHSEWWCPKLGNNSVQGMPIACRHYVMRQYKCHVLQYRILQKCDNRQVQYTHGNRVRFTHSKLLYVRLYKMPNIGPERGRSPNTWTMLRNTFRGQRNRYMLHSTGHKRDRQHRHICFRRRYYRPGLLLGSGRTNRHHWPRRRDNHYPIKLINITPGGLKTCHPRGILFIVILGLDPLFIILWR